MDSAIALDIHNQIKNFIFPAHWTALEGPTLGDYSGNWDTNGASGFKVVGELIAQAKSYNPPRGVGFYLNLNGNGDGNQSGQTSFPTWICPSYLNSSTYYSSGQPGTGGCVYNTTGSINYVQVRYWNANVASRIVALVKAYYDKFGPDTPTGGIYMWDAFSEMSVPTSSGITWNELYTTMQNVYLPGPTGGLRGAAPRWYMTMRPTFINGPSNNYQLLFNLMKASYISPSDEDTMNKVAVPGAVLTDAQQNHHEAWCSQAFRGLPAFTGNANQTWPDHATLGDWDYCGNVESAETGPPSQNGTDPVPPANQGSGYLYASSRYPGIFNGINSCNMSHVIIYLDAGMGPNVNRGTRSTSSSAPANPAGGPAAGSNATRPCLEDVITGNTSYSGITGPLTVAKTSYPQGYPK